MQVSRIETGRKLKMIEAQEDMLKTSKKKYEITDKEVSALDPSARYEQMQMVFFTCQGCKRRAMHS